MPRTKTGLNASEFAVLGLVRQRPTYGYEIQRQLGTPKGLGRACPVEPAMVYAILKSLSGLELIDGTWDNSSYPPRAVYSTTDAGDVEFLRWLKRPVARIREVRHDFLVKLHFALGEDAAWANELLDAQIEVCREYLAEVGAERDAADDPYDAIVLDSKHSAAELTIAWLERTRELLRG